MNLTVILLNPFPNKPWFLRVCSTSLLKTLWEKEKSLVTSNFSFSHSVYLFGELSTILIKFEIVICKPFQFGKGLIVSFATKDHICFSHHDGKCKKHVHDVYLVKDKSVCILVCSFVIDSVQLTEKR